MTLQLRSREVRLVVIRNPLAVKDKEDEVEVSFGKTKVTVFISQQECPKCQSSILIDRFRGDTSAKRSGN